MCGIGGAVGLRGPTELTTTGMPWLVPCLAHRGPDGSGETRNGRVWFGHTRLAVIDVTERAAQPFADTGGRAVVVFNGEIVNYRELRSELIALGHGFRTTSDTEVLLHAYLEWGIGCLDRLAGMFAFALHDLRTDEVLLVRDRLGVKPLYYAEFGGQLLFSSEIKGIIRAPGFRRRLNPVAVSSFLSFRHPIGPETYFAGVRALAPGHWMRITSSGRYHVRRWWQLPDESPYDLDSSEGRAGLSELMSHVMAQTSVSDVPVAALLSGGLDSSVIAWEVARQTGRPPLTFTARLAGDDYDETVYAAKMAAHLGAEHAEVPVSADAYLAQVRPLIRVKDQPLGMHNEAALQLLARAVRPRAKVVLSGEGADELFLGYGRIFRAPFDHRRLRLARMLPRGVRDAWLRAMGGAESEVGLDTLAFFLHRYCYWPIRTKLALFTPAMHEAVSGDAPLVGEVARAFAPAGGSFQRQLGAFFLTTHLRGLLEVMDSSFMASGVEVRVPFTDHRLVEAVHPLPLRHKLRWRSPRARLAALTEPVGRFSERRDETKHLLRAMYRHRLPEFVTTRPKMVFPVPLDRWMDGELRASYEKLLFDGDARIGELIDQTRLAQWLATQQSDGRDALGRRVWLLLNLELWLREYFDGPLL